jgi:hypothetical protein
LRWQEDEGFVNWMLEVRYAEVRDGEVHPFLLLGAVLYMYEAYSQGKETQKREPIVSQ